MIAPNERPLWAETDLRCATIGDQWVAISEKGTDPSGYLELLRLNPAAARRLAAELIAGATRIEEMENSA